MHYLYCIAVARTCTIKQFQKMHYVIIPTNSINAYHLQVPTLLYSYISSTRSRTQPLTPLGKCKTELLLLICTDVKAEPPVFVDTFIPCKLHLDVFPYFARPLPSVADGWRLLLPSGKVVKGDFRSCLQWSLGNQHAGLAFLVHQHV